MNTVQAKRETLRKVILGHAHGLLKSNGVSEIKMRSLATASDCSVGTLYNVFKNINEIYFHLNIRTIKELLHLLFAELKQGTEEKAHLKEILPRMGWVYIRFGQNNLHCWKALFETQAAAPPPYWYTVEISKEMKPFEELLMKEYLFSLEKANQLINYFWFAIHGVSSIILNKKATNHSEEFLQKYVDHCLRGIYELL